jgi:hypothetical protein
LKLSATAATRQEEFDKRLEWRVADIRRLVASVVVPDQPTLQILSSQIKRVQNANLEPQKEWKGLFELIGCRSLFDTHETNSCHLVDRDGSKHFPDFSCAVGSTVIWERLVWIAELKKKLTDSEWRNAVVQAFSRIVEIFDHQPDREIVPSVVLDREYVSFVRVERGKGREFQLFVSERLRLFESTNGDANSSTRQVWIRRSHIAVHFRNSNDVNVEARPGNVVVSWA